MAKQTEKTLGNTDVNGAKKIEPVTPSEGCDTKLGYAMVS